MVVTRPVAEWAKGKLGILESEGLKGWLTLFTYEEGPLLLRKYSRARMPAGPAPPWDRRHLCPMPLGCEF